MNVANTDASTSTVDAFPSSRLSSSASLRVCVVAPLTTLSGNLATATRIGSFFDRATIMSSVPPATALDESLWFDVCFFIHAVRGGMAVFPELFAANRNGLVRETSVDEFVGPDSLTTTPSPLSSPLLTAASLATHSQQPPIVRARRYVLVFGGTDVNEGSSNAALQQAMASVIQRVDAVVCFSQGLREVAVQRFPMCADVLTSPSTHVIPQSVSFIAPLVPVHRSPDSLLALAATESECLDKLIVEASAHSMQPLPVPQAGGPPTLVVILPAGIRRVKDPLFAVQAWEELFRRRCESQGDAASMSQQRAPSSNVALVIVGPALEQDVVLQLQNTIASNPGCHVYWHPGIEHAALMELFKVSGELRHHATAPDKRKNNLPSRLLCVLNTSRSEGQSQTLLEAMAAGIPVVARSIRANVELLHPPHVVSSATTISLTSPCGTLVESPRQLADAIEHMTTSAVSVAMDQQPQRHLVDTVETAVNWCRLHHSFASEAAAYQRIVAGLC